MIKLMTKKSIKIMQEIVSGLEMPGDSKKLDSNCGYMPLSVENVGITEKGNMYSLAHYGEQNGDLMRDPDMVFLELKKPEGTIFYPVSYQNDYVGKYDECMEFLKTGKPILHRKSYLSMLDFAEEWLENIKEQQKINVN